MSHPRAGVIAEAPSTAGGDGGFTLVEVVVALALLGVLATAAIAMTVSSLHRSSSLQQRNTAVMVATEAMESALAVPAGLLVTGRSAEEVAAQWSTPWARTTSAQTAATWPASDPQARTSSTSTPAVPLGADPRVAGQTYHVETLIGTCYVARPQTACTRQGPTEPAGNTSYYPMRRVVVTVTWSGGTTTGCSASGCRVTISRLADPSSDLRWNATDS